MARSKQSAGAAPKQPAPAKKKTATTRSPGRPKKVADEDLIAALLEDPSPSAVAKKLGLHRNTIVARLRDEKTRELLREHRSRAAEAAAAALADLAGKAVKTLEDLLEDSTPQDSVRLGAAQAVLKFVEKTVVEQQAAEEPDEIWEAPPQFEVRVIEGGRKDAS